MDSTYLRYLIALQQEAASEFVMSWLTHFIIPFTRVTDVILDLGCGDGVCSKPVKCSRMIGVDIWEKTRTLYHSEFVLGDITKLSDVSALAGVRPDVTLLLDAIEHLDRKPGEELLSYLDKITNRSIIVFTPAVFDDNERNVIDPKMWSFGNESNRHRSLWSQEDFALRGYECAAIRGEIILATKTKPV